MVSSPTDAPDSVTKPKPDVTAPTDRITQQAQAGADNLSSTSPFRAGKDTTLSTPTDTQVKSASEQMSMGAGIGTAGKTESFQASDGSTIQGQTYTSKDGTFMKVAGGDDGKGSTYQIEQGDNGQRNLSKIDSDGNKEPVALKQQNDSTNNGRAPEATPTPVDRAPQAQQQPDVTGDKAPKTPEKAPTPAPEAPVSNSPRASSPESQIASTPERQTPAAVDAPSTPPRNDQSFAPPARNDGQSPQVHNDVQSPQVHNEVQSPQVRNDVQSPQVRNEGQSPQVRNDVQSPQVRNDVQSPQVHNEVQSPQVRNDVQSPQVHNEVQSPQVHNDTQVAASSPQSDRVGSGGDRVGSGGDRVGSGGDRLRSTVGSGSVYEQPVAGSGTTSGNLADRPAGPNGQGSGYDHPVTSGAAADHPLTGSGTGADRTITGSGSGYERSSGNSGYERSSGNSGFDRPGSTTGSGSGDGAINSPPTQAPKTYSPPADTANLGAQPGAGRVNQPFTPGRVEQPSTPVQKGELPSPTPRAGAGSEAPVVSQAGHANPTVSPVVDAPAPVVTPSGRTTPTFTPPADAVSATPPAHLNRAGAGDGGNHDYTGGREGEKRTAAPIDATQQPAAPAQNQPGQYKAPVVTDSNSGSVNTSLGNTRTENAGGYHPDGYHPDGYHPDGYHPEGYHPEGSTPPFASPPGSQGPRGDIANGKPGDVQASPPANLQRIAANDGAPGPLPPRTNEIGGSGGELNKQQRMPNAEANARNSIQDSSTMSGLRPPGSEAPGATSHQLGDSFAPTDTAARNGMPGANAAGAGAEAAALNAASRAGADHAAMNAASRANAGADAAAMLAASRPGAGDALAKVSAPPDVLAPSAAQNKMLQQAGFNANNPSDAAFLSSARAQLLSTNLHDGTNTTLATALNGANQANLNKLAVLLTGKADATPNNVVLNEANMARLNALFKPDASAMKAGMAASLDAKNAAALGLTSVLTGRQPALNQMSQKEVYGELNKLGSSLIPGQTLAIGDLLSRNLIRPTDLAVGVGLLAKKLEPLEIKPTTGTLTANPENALATANAIAAARARALDAHGEVVPGKPITLAPHTDLAEGLGLVPGALVPGALIPGKGIPVDGKLPDGIADKIADSRIGPTGRPIAITSAEAALLNTKNAADAARANATKNIEVAEGTGGSELTLGTRKDMAELGDKLDPKKKPDGKAGDGQGISIDGSLLTGAALRLFGDKKDEKKDETNASSKVDETKSQRRKYLIKEGDTLDSIAQEGFGDSQMSVLIAAVNSEVIAKDTDPYALLQIGLSIWLPSEMEVEDFLATSTLK